MLRGEVDVAYASEYVTVRQAFERADVRIFAVEARSMGTYIVGRKDRGIETVPDLKGKRVGVPKGAIPDSYDYVYAAGLAAVRPEAVDMGR